ncbi:hypothetical protein HDU98_011324 [Podochytrium sp. JEL0797]|nr:hypothetical protein HDU98_011324 [Podochytrium sp. JEL0797]
MGLLDTIHNARTQVVVISFVCFLCPGMFNALNALPAAGPSAANVKDQQNAALYLCFAIMGLLAGGLNNIVGPRILASIGGTGFALYSGAQYNVFRVQGGDKDAPIPQSANAFSIFSGAYVGICAGMLWAAQGQICLTYPTESQKGTFFAIFWIIFNCGALVGNTIGTILAWPAGAGGFAMSDALYFVFIALMCLGSVVAMLIQPPGTIIREDQSQVAPPPDTNVLKEFVNILKMFTNPHMLCLLIPCMSSNWYYSYEFGVFGTYFSGRTNGLKAIFYWFMEAAGSWVLGHYFLDNHNYTRTKRAWIGWMIMCGCALAIFGGGAAFEYVVSRPDFVKIDAGEAPGSFIGPFFLYAFYGMFDAFFQTYLNYLIGSIANDAETLSRYAGFYKGTQSLGNGIAWALTGFAFTPAKGNALTGTDQFWIMCAPVAASCVCFAIFNIFYMTDTNNKSPEEPKVEPKIVSESMPELA